MVGGTGSAGDRSAGLNPPERNPKSVTPNLTVAPIVGSGEPRTGKLVRGFFVFAVQSLAYQIPDGLFVFRVDQVGWQRTGC